MASEAVLESEQVVPEGRTAYNSLYARLVFIDDVGGVPSERAKKDFSESGLERLADLQGMEFSEEQKRVMAQRAVNHYGTNRHLNEARGGEVNMHGVVRTAERSDFRDLQTILGVGEKNSERAIGSTPFTILNSVLIAIGIYAGIGILGHNLDGNTVELSNTAKALASFSVPLLAIGYGFLYKDAVNEQNKELDIALERAAYVDSQLERYELLN